MIIYQPVMNIADVHAVLVHRLSLMTYTSYLPCQYPYILLTGSQETRGNMTQPSIPAESPSLATPGFLAIFVDLNTADVHTVLCLH